MKYFSNLVFLFSTLTLSILKDTFAIALKTTTIRNVSSTTMTWTTAETHLAILQNCAIMQTPTTAQEANLAEEPTLVLKDFTTLTDTKLNTAPLST